MSINVLIVDDHVVMAEGLRHRQPSHSGVKYPYRTVACFHNGLM